MHVMQIKYVWYSVVLPVNLTVKVSHVISQHPLRSSASAAPDLAAAALAATK
jgi:hypothetical protein